MSSEHISGLDVTLFEIERTIVLARAFIAVLGVFQAQHPIHRIRPVVDGIRKNNHLQLHNDKIRERGNSVPARAWLRGLFRGGTATKENFGTVVKVCINVINSARTVVVGFLK